MMTGAGVFHHFLHPGPVLGRLKGIGLKISVISLKIKGESMEYLPLFLQLPGTDSCDQGTVHPSGEKGTDGHIRKHLKLYRHPPPARRFFPQFLQSCLREAGFAAASIVPSSAFHLSREGRFPLLLPVYSGIRLSHRTLPVPGQRFRRGYSLSATASPPDTGTGL